MNTTPSPKFHHWDFETGRLDQVYGRSRFDVHNSEHSIGARGHGFVLDAMSRGLELWEVECIVTMSKNSHRWDVLCYRPAFKPNGYCQTHRQTKKMRPYFYGEPTERIPGIKQDRWWLYDQVTGEWNPKWKRPGER